MPTRRTRTSPWYLAVAGAAFAPVAQAASRLGKRPPPPHAIEATRRTIETRAGAVLVYEETRGATPPVLLLHSVGPVGCIYEVAGLFEALRAERTVVAAELPGYGASSQGPGGHGAEVTLAASIEELVEELALRHGERVDVVAVGRTARAAALAARRAPAHVRSLVMVSPPRADHDGPLTRAMTTPLRRALASLVGRRAVGALVHRVATSRPALELWLGRRAACVPRGLVHHAWIAARQPGAGVAPLTALREALLEDGSPLPSVAAATLVIFGAAEVPEGVLRSPLAVAGRTLAVVPATKALPHVERPAETAQAMQAFWLAQRPRPELRLVRGSGLGRAPYGRTRRGEVAPDGARRR